MLKSELVCLDTFNTYKPIPNDILHIPEKLLDYGIKWKGKQLYGSNTVNCNHVRIYVGIIDGEYIGFEWTHPRARFIVIEDWMLDSDYAKIYRHSSLSKIVPYNQTVFAKIVKNYLINYGHEGSRYDYLQLLGIALGVKGLQCSKHRKVCAHGAIDTQEAFIGDNLFPESETWATLPCAWMNHPNKFILMNGTENNKKLKPELTTHSAFV